MSAVEIITLFITILCLLSFCAVFTILFRHYFKSNIDSVSSGKEDIELIDNAIDEEKEKQSKSKKAWRLVGKVFSCVLLGVVFAFFVFSLASKIQNNTMLFGDSTLVVIASGSMSEKNNDIIKKHPELNNQFDTYDIIARFGFHVTASNNIGKALRLGRIGTSHCEVGQSAKGYFLCVARTAEYGQIVLGHVVHLTEKLGAHQIFVGNDTLDGGDDELVVQFHLEFLQMVLEVRRGRDEDERTARAHHLVNVAGESDAVRIKMNARQIAGVVSQTLELVNAVLASHVPGDMVHLFEHNFGYRRGPTSAAHNGYGSTHIAIPQRH